MINRELMQYSLFQFLNNIAIMLKHFIYIISLCFCISAEAQRLNKEVLYDDAICRLHKILLQASYLNTSDTLYIILNDKSIKVKKVNIISNDFPQLIVGESRSIYILDTMESHGKKLCIHFNICQLIQESILKRRIVSSGCFVFFYKVRKSKYYYYTYKDYGI